MGAFLLARLLRDGVGDFVLRAQVLGRIAMLVILCSSFPPFGPVQHSGLFEHRGGFLALGGGGAGKTRGRSKCPQGQPAAQQDGDTTDNPKAAFEALWPGLRTLAVCTAPQFRLLLQQADIRRKLS